MPNYKLDKIDLEVNQVTGNNYYFFVYDADKMKLKKDIKYVDDSAMTESKYIIFAADTEQECINKKNELGL